MFSVIYRARVGRHIAVMGESVSDCMACGGSWNGWLSYCKDMLKYTPMQAAELSIGRLYAKREDEENARSI